MSRWLREGPEAFCVLFLRLLHILVSEATETSREPLKEQLGRSHLEELLYGYMILCYIRLYDTISCYIILHCSILYHVILYYTIVYYITLYYTLLCSIILFYILDDHSSVIRSLKNLLLVISTDPAFAEASPKQGESLLEAAWGVVSLPGLREEALELESHPRTYIYNYNYTYYTYTYTYIRTYIHTYTYIHLYMYVQIRVDVCLEVTS